MKNYHSKKVNLKFRLKKSSRLDARSSFAYYGYHNQARFHNIFQTEHFSAI